MKLLTWNVNGLRSVGKKTFVDWFKAQEADVVCVQEIKTHPDVLEENLRHPGNYHSYFHSAHKGHYSGVATFSKTEPLRIQYGIGEHEIDCEGRVLITEYPKFVLINTYFPNSRRDHGRLPFKLSFCDKMLTLCESYRKQGKQVIVCGDFNIAHHEIDLRNPKSNKNNAGFLPEERAWMTHFLNQGYIDGFRHFIKGPDHYTWWSYRPGVRERNVGWRIDYFVVNKEFEGYLKAVDHQPEIKGSDHCPVMLRLDLEG